MPSSIGRTARRSTAPSARCHRRRVRLGWPPTTPMDERRRRESHGAAVVRLQCRACEHRKSGTATKLLPELPGRNRVHLGQIQQLLPGRNDFVGDRVQRDHRDTQVSVVSYALSARRAAGAAVKRSIRRFKRRSLLDPEYHRVRFPNGLPPSLTRGVVGGRDVVPEHIDGGVDDGRRAWPGRRPRSRCASARALCPGAPPAPRQSAGHRTCPSCARRSPGCGSASRE